MIQTNKPKVLITGCAGFIGSSLVDRLLGDGFEVVGIDNFNDYYDPKIKEGNLGGALSSDSFKLFREDILNAERLNEIFGDEKVEKVVHLAARAGVRPSIENPNLYAEVNVMGTVNVLKASVDFGVEQFVFGSSSSVYGNSKRVPFKEDDICVDIISPYGASKRAAEFFVESFHNSYDLNCISLRFFTVYGPRGRVDMAPALFTKSIMGGLPINKFGNGSSSRDYTYIDDIVDGIVLALSSDISHEVINLGNNHPVTLNEFIKTCESVTGLRANTVEMPNQPGDVEKTWADIVKAKELLGWSPKVNLANGLEKYYKWLSAKS